MTNDKEELSVEIDETPEVEEKEEFSVGGLLPEEVEMASSFGLTEEGKEEDGEHEEQPEGDTEEDSEEEEVNTDPDNFEDMDKVIEKDEKKFHEKYTPNQKALYFKSKAEKKRRQELQKELAELKTALESTAKGANGQKKVDEIAKLLQSGEDLTVEQLQSIINSKETVETAEEPIKPEVIQQKVAVKADYAEKIGNAKYGNFEAISNLAKEMIAGDNTGTYQKIIDNAFLSDEVDEAMLVETVVNIAKLSPKFGEASGKAELEETKKANKVIKNLKRKTSSAAIGGSGKRIVSESDLTCDQASKLSAEQFSKLSESTQKRILMGIDP